MRINFVSTMRLLLLSAAFASAASGQGPVVKDPNPKPVLKPDLTISGIIWRKKPNVAVIVVQNVGKGKAGPTTGGYSCRSAPNKQGIAIGYATMFFVTELMPSQRLKITLDCGKDMVLNAGVDGEKKVAESNEGNNEMSFE